MGSSRGSSVLVLLAALTCPIAAALTACRNATLVYTPDSRVLLVEQSDSSPDALRVRSMPCECTHRAPSACGCNFDDELPGALLPPETPWCDDPLPLVTLQPGATEPLELLAGAAGGGNLRLLLTPDARMRFERRSDSALLVEEAVPHSFAPVVLRGQAPHARHTALNVSFAAFARERLYGLGQHQLAHCTGGVGRAACTHGVLDLKGANHTECGKSGTECTGDRIANCTKKQPCHISKHQRDGRSNLHGACDRNTLVPCGFFLFSNSRIGRVVFAKPG